MVKYKPKKPRPSKALLLLTSLLLVSGCSTAQNAAVDAITATAIQGVKDFEDRKAAGLIAGSCAITIGALVRLENSQLQQALLDLCTFKPSITIEDLIIQPEEPVEPAVPIS